MAEPGAVKVFAAVLQQAEAWPGTPLLLCGPDPVTARLITAEAGPSVPMFDTVADRCPR